MTADRTQRRLWPPGRVLVAVYGVVAAVLGGVALLGLATDRSMGFLTRDPTYAVSLEGCERASCAYAGVLSQLGVLLTAGAVVVAAIAAWRSPDRSRPRRLMAGACAVSLLVLVDDAFMVHDGLLAYVHPAGEKATLLVLACAVGAFVVAFRRDFGLPGLLAFAAVAFATSLGVDQAFDDPPRLVEDGAKFTGLVSWASWVTLVARPSLSRPVA